jgi:hypothetical protein
MGLVEDGGRDEVEILTIELKKRELREWEMSIVD